MKDSISEKTKETKTFSERLFSRNEKLKALKVVKENQYFTASEIKFCYKQTTGNNIYTQYMYAWIRPEPHDL